jgi:Uma2 family endonuclease
MDLAEQGFFKDDRVELIRGEIRLMSPQGPVHPTVIDIAMRRLDRAFEGLGFTRVQSTFEATDDSRPEPDLIVLPGKPQDYFKHLPSAALLLVEVSFTTQRYDRGEKLSIYAEAGVGEYWIIDAKARRLEVYREPKQDGQGDWRYAQTQTLELGDTVTPTAAPERSIAVSELMT